LEPDAPTSSETKPLSDAPDSGVTTAVSGEGVNVPLAEANAGFAEATLAELRRVVWPSRQQLFSESVAVILMVSLSAAAIAALDRFYGWAATQVFR
jgi:preprotein translocase subunit SecE